MSSDDDIPVLRDAIVRKPNIQLSPEQLDEVCDSLSATAWVLIDKLLTDALKDAEEALRLQINDRLSEEFPAMIEAVLSEKLGSRSEE